jgi:PAS domain S-box-containing protein
LEKRLAERWLDATFTHAALGIAEVGLDGVFLRANPRFCEIVGYTEEELRRLSFRDVTHPEDLALDERQLGRLRGGEVATYTVEKRYLRADGVEVWVELTRSLARDPAGEVLGFITVANDISRRKSTEAALARAWQQAAEARRLEALGRVAGGIAHDFNNLLVGIRGGARVRPRQPGRQRDRGIRAGARPLRPGDGARPAAPGLRSPQAYPPARARSSRVPARPDCGPAAAARPGGAPPLPAQLPVDLDPR